MKSKNTTIGYLYLLIAIAGGISTTASNLKFITLYGPSFDILKFISMASNNPASQSLSFDLFFLGTAIFLWMFLESKRLEMKNFWIFILSTFTIAIAFSAPLFLFFRERRLIEIENLKA